jgi:AcrR family transcriptional regulator
MATVAYRLSVCQDLPEDTLNQRAERGQATRTQLVDVATRLFAERGYDGTAIEAVLEAAGVSRGSLYHHFPSKQALFEAAFEAVETSIGEEVAAASIEGVGDVLSGLRAGSMAWMRLAGDPVVKRIVLLDAPAVLGWERWREIEHEHALGGLKLVMQVAADEGRIPPDLVDVFAHTVLAMVNELALLIARAPDQAAAQRTAEEAVDTILNRLLGAQP